MPAGLSFGPGSNNHRTQTDTRMKWFRPRETTMSPLPLPAPRRPHLCCVNPYLPAETVQAARSQPWVGAQLYLFWLDVETQVLALLSQLAQLALCSPCSLSPALGHVSPLEPSFVHVPFKLEDLFASAHLQLPSSSSSSVPQERAVPGLVLPSTPRSIADGVVLSPRGSIIAAEDELAFRCLQGSSSNYRHNATSHPHCPSAHATCSTNRGSAPASRTPAIVPSADRNPQSTIHLALFSVPCVYLPSSYAPLLAIHTLTPSSPYLLALPQRLQDRILNNVTRHTTQDPLALPPSCMYMSPQEGLHVANISPPCPGTHLPTCFSPPGPSRLPIPPLPASIVYLEVAYFPSHLASPQPYNLYANPPLPPCPGSVCLSSQLDL
ncbi:hypothetical protein B0I35DRAFT_131457 [Stachybotrys elegans]|uniref:Uncharacterized protein n=1 Tax=Stachybotrys elegans TaxID=80388 RepID=A0A8K0WWX2_9HYPO|nr:hypothetical protein B0I35DRAFT_131457 [Stachybotrys elegans]